MKVLLIEDDPVHCEEYIYCTQYLPYETDLKTAGGCRQGIELVQQQQPDVILLDLELHTSDKDGLLFLAELKTLPLDAMPYIIIITHNTSPRTYQTARQCGADYIFPKAKPDYSPKLVLDFAYNFYVNQPGRSVLYSRSRTNYEAEINYEMDKIGIANGMSGRKYITEAILILINLFPDEVNAGSVNLQKDIYSVIARNNKKSIGSIEQGIKNAIQKAWLVNDIDILAENFTVSVSYQTGYPMNKDFLFYYVDKIKKKRR